MNTLRQTIFYPDINEYDDKIYYGIHKEDYIAAEMEILWITMLKLWDQW